MRILKSKLAVLEEERRANEARSMKAATSSGDFGQQIRTYTLHPYQQVKDHRSGYDTSQVQEVLKNGQLGEIIMSVLTTMRMQEGDISN